MMMASSSDHPNNNDNHNENNTNIDIQQPREHTHTTTLSESDEVNRPRGHLIGGTPSSSFSFIPSVLSTVSFILSVASLSVCNFFQREVLFEANTTTGDVNFLTTSRGVGFFTYAGKDEFEGLCIQYPRYAEEDAYWKSARAFAVLATVVGGLAMISLWLASCIPFNPAVFHAMGILLLCGTLFQGLSFLLIHSPTLCKSEDLPGLIQTSLSCKLAYGSRMAIAATVFFFVGCLSTITVPPPDIPDAIPLQQKTTVTETRHPDGTFETVTKTELVENIEYD